MQKIVPVTGVTPVEGLIFEAKIERYFLESFLRERNNRIMSVYGLSRTVVPHLLQANSRLTQSRAHHKQLLVDPTFARVFIIIC